RLEWGSDATPASPLYGDVYFSREGGFGESEHVFIRGNDLLARFADGRASRVLETGFGTGRNFLATALCFLETAPPGARLDFVSLEKHPIDRDDLQRLARAQRELAEPWLDGHSLLGEGNSARLARLQDELHRQWPDAIPGFHRRLLAGGRIRLTLVWGDARDQLPEIDGAFDAFFLDGFAPARNPELWDEALLAELGRRAAPGATAATYSAARRVVDALGAAGFATEKCPGFGRKRDMLVGRHAGADGVAATGSRRGERRIAVIGAGVAGASLAHLAAQRGMGVEVFEAESAPAGGGSGNPAGLVAPVMSRDWNRLSQLTATGMGFMRELVRETLGPADADDPAYGFHGVIKLARQSRHAERQSRIAAELCPDPAFACWAEAGELRERSGLPDIDCPGWWFPGAGWIRPRATIRHWLDRAGVPLHLDCPVRELRGVPGAWEVITEGGGRHGPYTDVVVAGGERSVGLAKSLKRWIEPCRGQVSWVDAGKADTSLSPGVAIMREGYALDLPGVGLLFGASFLPGQTDRELRVEEGAENLGRLASIAGSLSGAIPPDAPLHGRASIRATTPDRLPVVGELAEGLWISTGHGARGLTWSAWLAEFLVSCIDGTPSPLPRSLAEGLQPQRFDEREARRAATRREKGGNRG
ncbi:FAD-dependent 5-carboxymethylaminomethyl-2-thiouridine(34) oxidoreductase MnmC, partial [Guyparkeria sp.]|uniref:FAD-dependent 5-carboxymethylaminomethyl-2-thiouridine(34) oxidoreductase MnmC n=1 Tax=Guyparkeria sp. TaxID=2035736 RepID=UPI003970FA7B